MLATLITSGLMLVHAAGEYETSAGKHPLALRIARVEADLCISHCPPTPKEPTSDWLRSDEGRKANACPMLCRVEQPAALMFREMVELTTGATFDPNAPAILALGKDAPDLARRLRLAAHDVEGKRLWALCTRARRLLAPGDEAAYLECTGRTRRDGPGALPPPDSTRALRCAVAFTERELDWLVRCNAMEARIDIDSCVAGEGGDGAKQHRRHPGDAKERCESDAADRLAAAFRQAMRR